MNKEVREKLVNAVENITWETLTQGLKGMFQSKVDQYEDPNQEVVTYHASSDAAAILIAPLTGGEKFLENVDDFFGSFRKMSKYDWEKIDLPETKVTDFNKDLKASPELSDLITEKPEMAKSWDKLGSHHNRTNVKILEARKSFDDVDPSFGKSNPHTGSEMFDPETGGYVITDPGHNIIAGNADSKAEFTIAESFSKNGKKVKLLNENQAPGIPTPDAEVEGIGIFDFKNISPTATNIERNVRDKVLDVSRQADNLALNLGDNAAATTERVNQGVLDAISTADGGGGLSLPSNIGVTYPDGSLKILTIQQIRDGARF